MGIKVEFAWWIYKNGPAAFGMLGGADEKEVCASMTRVPADTWGREVDACSHLLARDFRAFSIGASLVGGALLVWKSIDICILSCMRRL